METHEVTYDGKHVARITVRSPVEMSYHVEAIRKVIEGPEESRTYEGTIEVLLVRIR